MPAHAQRLVLVSIQTLCTNYKLMLNTNITLQIFYWLSLKTKKLSSKIRLKHTRRVYMARMYLQLPLWQWGAGNVYTLALSSWKVNIAEKPITVMGL